MLSEINQTLKDKYCPLSLKHKQMNTTKEKQTHTYREQISGYHWGEKRERGKTGKED